MPKTIPVKEALETEAIFIDTRTPKEFQEDHLPKAINLPILSNEERHLVGITYKQVSQEKALEQGISYFSKKLPEFMKEVGRYKDQKIIFYCWRGGLRSRAVTALLDSLGYDVLQLQGGYKYFRNYVRESLENYQLKAKLMVLWGLTCTGKTELLNQFPNCLDLEGLAQHRGSLYGAVGLTPVSQKRFENLLWQRLEQLKREEIIIIEGESRKIGRVQIPLFLYQRMLQGKHILITWSLDNRAEYAVKSYFKDDASLLQIKEITNALPRLLSPKQKQKIIELIDQRQLKEAAKMLLELYYDPLYNHTLRQLDFSAEINNDQPVPAAKKLALLMKDQVRA